MLLTEKMARDPLGYREKLRTYEELKIEHRSNNHFSSHNLVVAS
jgi:hypothetical protein